MVDPLDRGLALRRTLAAFPTGVVVVAAEFGGITRGMTANAFISLALEPPLVLLSIARASRMAPIMASARRYGVSILGDHQDGIAQHFAGRIAQGEIEFEPKAGAPLIGGAVAHLVCDLVQTHEVADHTLFIGEVTYHHRKAGTPLMFLEGSFRSAG